MKDWVIMTSGERPLADVAKDLSERGLEVGEVLEQLGMITGVGGDEVADKVRKVAGVTDVSSNAGADVGPPDSTDTW